MRIIANFLCVLSVIFLAAGFTLYGAAEHLSRDPMPQWLDDLIDFLRMVERIE